MTQEPKCERCRWFQMPDRYCRRYPPTGAISFNGFARFPKVQSQDFCGEFQPKDQHHD